MKSFVSSERDKRFQAEQAKEIRRLGKLLGRCDIRGGQFIHYLKTYYEERWVYNAAIHYARNLSDKELVELIRELERFAKPATLPKEQ